MAEGNLEAARLRFTRIYDAHYHRILGYALRRLRSDDAADVVAETFAVAWRRLERVPDGEQALYWLYATARRVAANHRRAEERRRGVNDALVAALPFPATTDLAPRSRRVADALSQLRADERELLLLVAWEGLDAAAVATVLGCTRNAARIRIHRARRSFAEALHAVDEREQDAFAAAAREPRLRLEDPS